MTKSKFAFILMTVLVAELVRENFSLIRAKNHNARISELHYERYAGVVERFNDTLQQVPQPLRTHIIQEIQAHDDFLSTLYE